LKQNGHRVVVETNAGEGTHISDEEYQSAGAEILTVEYKLNLIRPAMPPTLRAEARVLRAGRTLTVCRADVFHTGPGGPEACALLQSTLMRMEPAS